MRLLFELVHPQYPALPRRVAHRRAARGIVLRGTRILLLYTGRYNDYSLPGGGVDSDEDLHAALCRELEEETGARNVRVVSEFGQVLESRPHRGEHDAMRMQSFVYRCEIDDELAAPRMEHYEQANGMRAEWVELKAALDHNRGVIERRESAMGLSIERETRLLQQIADELVPGSAGRAIRAA